MFMVLPSQSLKQPLGFQDQDRIFMFSPHVLEELPREGRVALTNSFSHPAHVENRTGVFPACRKHFFDGQLLRRRLPGWLISSVVSHGQFLVCEGALWQLRRHTAECLFFFFLHADRGLTVSSASSTEGGNRESDQPACKNGGEEAGDGDP
jgi:hypothetical protein